MKALVQYLRTPRRAAWLVLPALVLFLGTAGDVIPTADAQATGTINIQKQLVDPQGNAIQGGSVQGFQFVLTNVTTTPAIQTTVTTNAQGQASASVAPGTYTIQENAPAGTTLVNVTPGQSFQLAGGGVVNVVATNRVPGQGAITITKQVVDANGAPVAGADVSGFQFTVTGPGGFSQQVTTTAAGTAQLSNLALGAYTITETERAGFQAVAMRVENVQFPPGQPVVVQLTAADPSVNITALNRAATTGTVTVTKQVVDPNGAPVAGADLSGFQFTLACGTTTGQAQTTAATGTISFTNVPAGNCVITESTRSGFTIASITPTGGQNILVQGTTGGTFAVAAGQTIALTVVNRQLPTGGTVTVTKQMVDANGAVIGTADVSGFQFTITCGTGAGAFTQAQTTTGATALTFTSVPAGTCTITETARTGFNLVSITPAGGQNIVASGQLGGNFTVTAGQTAALTVQNRVAAAATQVIQLFPGCNNQTSTWPNGTRTEVVAAAVSPAANLIAIWRHDAAANRFFGFSTLPGAPNDLLTVDFLQPLFFCMREAGTLTRPVVE